MALPLLVIMKLLVSPPTKESRDTNRNRQWAEAGFLSFAGIVLYALRFAVTGTTDGNFHSSYNPLIKLKVRGISVGTLCIFLLFLFVCLCE